MHSRCGRCTGWQRCRCGPRRAQVAIAGLQITVVGGGAGLALRIKAQQPAVVGLPAEGCAQVLLTASFGVEGAVGGDALGVYLTVVLLLLAEV